MSDPSRPGEVVDRIGAGDEREPWKLPRQLPAWRPGARGLRTLLAAQLVVLIAVPSTLAVANHRHDQALDQRALTAISVGLADGGDELVNDDASTVPLRLRNYGKERLQLLSVRVDRDGYTPLPLDQSLAPGARATLSLPLEKTCPKRVPTAGPTGLLVTVRTSRGQERTVRVPTFQGSFQGDYVFVQTQTCKLYDLSDSLGTDLVSSRVAGKDIELVLIVLNRASLPRSLVALQAPTGLRLVTTPRLPLVLPPVLGDTPTALRVDVQVSVGDCTRARRLLDGDLNQGAPQPVPSLLPGVDERLLPAPNDLANSVDLSALVGGDDVVSEVGLYLDNDLLPLVQALVARAC